MRTLKHWMLTNGLLAFATCMGASACDPEPDEAIDLVDEGSVPEGPKKPIPPDTGIKGTQQGSDKHGPDEQVDSPKYHPQPDGSFERIDPAGGYYARIFPDGSVRFDDIDKSGSRIAREKGGGLRFSGIGQWVAARSGSAKNPEAKLRFLRESQTFRDDLTIKAEEKRLNAQLNDLEQKLLMTWSGHSQPAAKRKQIFWIWDECLEETPIKGTDERSDIEKKRVAAGINARAQILEFIAKQMPKTESYPYTNAEIAEFNKGRKSLQRFVPYK